MQILSGLIRREGVKRKHLRVRGENFLVKVENVSKKQISIINLNNYVIELFGKSGGCCIIWLARNRLGME